MYQCPNCGNSLKFDIISQKMKCESCNSFFDPYAVTKESDAEEHNEDDAKLLTDKEKEDLRKEMIPLTEYGNVAFKSISENKYISSKSYVFNYYDKNFGSEKCNTCEYDQNL